MRFLIYNSFSYYPEIISSVEAASYESAQQFAEQQFPFLKGIRVILDYKSCIPSGASNTFNRGISHVV